MINKRIPLIAAALLLTPLAGVFAQALSNYAPVGVPLLSLGGGERNTILKLGLPLNIAGQLLIPGNDNTYIGFGAGEALSTGSFNTFLGSRAGAAVTAGIQNTFIGAQTGLKSTGQANTFLGYQSGRDNLGGNFNTFIGVLAGASNTTGSSNFIMGTNAGRNNTTGTGNFFLGDNSGGGNTTGSFNVYLGANAGDASGVNGQNNLAIGFESGRNNVGGFNNSFIGFRADAGAQNLTNATAIGNNAVVSASNSIVLGKDANVGIGTSAPQAKLEIGTGTAGVSGLRFTNLLSTSSATVSTSKVLTVDASGNVILANATVGGREGAEVLWKKNEAGTLQTTQLGAVVIGKDLRNTPAGYQLYVADGILTEKVKVAVKNSADWSDYVFANDYKLSPLSEVERFIKKNKHLPGVPSASEVVDHGIDVGKMDAKLLEKVEELTLYTIQLEKTNQQQEQRLQALEKLLGEMVNRK